MPHRTAQGGNEPDEGDPQSWTVEIWEDEHGRAPFEDWVQSDLSPYEQAVVTTAVQNVLKPLGNKICDTEWGKPLGNGLYEFRIRLSLQAVQTWGKPSTEQLARPGSDVPVLLRLFLTFYGRKIILLFHGYDKGKDPSERRQRREIKRAAKALKSWKETR